MMYYEVKPFKENIKVSYVPQPSLPTILNLLFTIVGISLLYLVYLVFGILYRLLTSVLHGPPSLVWVHWITPPIHPGVVKSK